MSDKRPDGEHGAEMPVKLLKWITPVCFEIAGAGRGWNVLLGNVPSWYGRGPNGVLLGPYQSQNRCAAEIQADIDSQQQGTPVMWKLTNLNRREDLRTMAVREEQYSHEPEVPVWLVSVPGEEPFHSIVIKDAVVESLRIEEAVEAANFAISEATRLNSVL